MNAEWSDCKHLKLDNDSFRHQRRANNKVFRPHTTHLSALKYSFCPIPYDWGVLATERAVQLPQLFVHRKHQSQFSPLKLKCIPVSEVHLEMNPGQNTNSLCIVSHASRPYELTEKVRHSSWKTTSGAFSTINGIKHWNNCCQFESGDLFATTNAPSPISP